MEEKITLDKESFKSLASGTRITILKSLDRRRKMLTELAKELKMSPSTVKEHMDNLCLSGLTEQMDEGHKWKYYELTRKGKNILHPSETRIWIMLSISALAFIGIFYDMIRYAFSTSTHVFSSAPRVMSETMTETASNTAGSANAPAAMDSAKAIAETGLAANQTAVAETGAVATQTVVTQTIVPYLHLAGLVIFAVLLGSLLTYLVISRKKMLMRI